MENSNFASAAEKILKNIANKIEDSAGNLEIDVDYSGGVLEVITQQNQHFVINKHDASRQIWVSSPLTGAYYFTLLQNGKWVDKNGVELQVLLQKELSAAMQIEINLLDL